MNENLEKHWYIVTCYSGNEHKVADNIERRIESMKLQDYVFRVIVAEEEVQKKDKDGNLMYNKPDENGVKTVKTKLVNIYPGYVFVEMIMTDESWFMVRNTPDVTGIAGSAGGGQKPIPVPAKEMETVLKRMGMVDISMYDDYHVGDFVKIINGTYANLEGRITAIDKEFGTVTVDTVFYGKHTPFTVEFSEIIHAD